MRSFIMAITLTAALFLPNLSFAQCAGCGADYNPQDRARTESIYQHQQIDQLHDRTRQEIDDSIAPNSVKDEYKTQNEELRELEHAAEEMGVGYPESSGGGSTR